MRSCDSKEDLKPAAIQTPVAHPGPAQDSSSVRSQLPPGTHCALSHDIQVLEGPIEGEVSAHRRSLLDALCDVRLAITSRTQVDLRSETTSSETQDHGHRLKAPSLPTISR